MLCKGSCLICQPAFIILPWCLLEIEHRGAGQIYFPANVHFKWVDQILLCGNNFITEQLVSQNYTIYIKLQMVQPSDDSCFAILLSVKYFTDTDIITDNIIPTNTDTITDYTDIDIGFIWTNISVFTDITDYRRSSTFGVIFPW